MSMIVNRRDLDFMMYEMLGLDKLLESERYGDYDREAITAILDSAQAIAEDKFAPMSTKLDENEPHFDGEKVHHIPELHEAYNAYTDAGFLRAGFDFDVDGLQLPWIASQAMNSIFLSANTPTTNYAMLTTGAANMLNACGSQALRDKYLPNMLDGKWSGTMCLSEPHCGSSLGDMRSKAERNDDGTFSIKGSKMWISGGEQSLTENIIHMVLAKIPGSPPGVRGISLFLVPKYRVDDAGNVGEANNVSLVGLNHKMGQRGCTNALLNFGENGDSIGYLVGNENEGLANMFHMMNEARIGVGLSATMCGLAGYLYSLDYARNRPQGRLIGEKDPESEPVMIIKHADVKRMLMAQKSYVEGAASLIYYCSGLIDQELTSDSKEEKQRLGLLLELLTPICKAWPSEFCLEANKLAIQILGGYGYTREYPVERYYRDNRLNHIHEGTWGIHGIDILGRKVRMANGAPLDILIEEINKTADAAANHAELAAFSEALVNAANRVKSTVADVSACSNPSLGLANATIFLDAIGHVVIAWLWLWQAKTALDADQSEADKAFYAGKVATCRYFFNYELPKVDTKLNLVSSLDDTCHDAEETFFTGV